MLKRTGFNENIIPTPAYPKHMKDKVAIVTGASAGIGAAISKQLDQEGCKLVLCARKQLNVIKNDLSDAIAIPTDVRREEQVKDMINTAMEHYGRIDILVNNAGIIRYGDMENYSTEDYKAVMETNVDGTFYTTREALPHIKRSQGNIVFIGSFDSDHPRSFNPIYAASKWWVKGFAHSIEAVYGKQISVSLINPSEVRTDIPDEDGVPYKNRYKEGEMLEPEEVAEAVIFALKRSKNATVSQLNLFRRDKLTEFF